MTHRRGGGVTHAALAATLLAVAALGCPTSESPSTAAVPRIGADRALERSGLAPYLRAAFETTHRERCAWIFAEADELERRATAGELDVVLLMDRGRADALAAAGVVRRVEVLGHEEAVIIGPIEDQFRSHGTVDPVEMVQNIIRSNYLVLTPAVGSSEHDVFRRLEKAARDRPGSGSQEASPLSGPKLVAELVKRKAFGVVLRSSILFAALEGVRPLRVYLDGQPDLVVPIVAAEVHPARTARPEASVLWGFLTGDASRGILEAFGAQRFGLPIYQPGLPAGGRGATVPGVDPRLLRSGAATSSAAVDAPSPP
jgi:ABC-type tungstate transport system permease subunit